jgi:hypothetical protein
MIGQNCCKELINHRSKTASNCGSNCDALQVPFRRRDRGFGGS